MGQYKRPNRSNLKLVKQTIVADDRDELNEAVETHKLDGWRETARIVRGDGSIACHMERRT